MCVCSDFDTMCEKTSVWIVYVAIINLNAPVTAVRLYPCDSGYRDVVENTAVTFHCDQYSGPVEWRYKGPQSVSFVPISMCNKTHCTASFVPGLTPTYISAGNSSLTTTLTSRNVSVAGGEYVCDGNRCRMHIIVPAIVSKPTGHVIQTDEGYYLQCNTSITSVYSSRGQYSCNWQIGEINYNGTLNLQPTPSDTNNTSYRAGYCDVTVPRVNDSGVYVCTVIIYPGNTSISSDSIPQDTGSTESPTASPGTPEVSSEKSATSLSTGAIIGVVLAVIAIVVIIVVVVVFVIRRKKVKSNRNKRPGRENSQHDAQQNIDDSVANNTSGAVGWDNPSPGAYESLHSGDIGLTSVYSQLPSAYVNVAATAGDLGDNPSFGAYESLKSGDIGLTSVYSQLPSAYVNVAATSGGTGRL